MTLYGRGWNRATPPLDVPFELNTDSPQATGLVAWWPTLASRGSAVLEDRAAHGYRMSLVSGTVSWVADPLLGCPFQFDGATWLAPLNNMPVPSLPVTLVFWHKPVSTTETGLFDSAPGVAGTFRNAELSGGMASWQGSANRAAMSMTAGAWNHHVITFWHNGDRMITIYKNGVFLSTTTASVGGSTVFGWTRFRIGGQGDSLEAYHGSVADGRVIQGQPSPSVIWQMYDPATRWDLYRPLRRFWPAFVAGAVSISPDLAGLGGLSIGGVA